MDKRKGMSNRRVISYWNQNGRHPLSSPPARFLEDADNVDGSDPSMVCRFSRECISVVELGIVKDASHIIAMKMAFRPGVINLWGLLSANGVSSVL